MKLILVGLFIFLINLPFGFWRSKVKKFSVKWFIAIHASIPLVYAVRIYAGVSWEVSSFIILIGAYFLGQYVGSRYISRYVKTR